MDLPDSSQPADVTAEGERPPDWRLQALAWLTGGLILLLGAGASCALLYFGVWVVRLMQTSAEIHARLQ